MRCSIHIWNCCGKVVFTLSPVIKINHTPVGNSTNIWIFVSIKISISSLCEQKALNTFLCQSLCIQQIIFYKKFNFYFLTNFLFADFIFLMIVTKNYFFKNIRKMLIDSLECRFFDILSSSGDRIQLMSVFFCFF